MSNQLPHYPALNLYEDTRCIVSGQYFCNLNSFALPVKGNAVSMLASGKDLFRQVRTAMRKAEKFIWIADWQMAFDVELDERGVSGNPGRLNKVIEEIIQKKAVHIRVLLYRSPFDDMEPKVYDALVSRTLNGLNRPGYPGTVQVMTQAATSDLGPIDQLSFSHHQKFVVIDGNTAFIGGLDLTYGRYDTPEFDVVVDPSQYVLNEMRNPCTPSRRGLTPAEQELVSAGFARPYAGAMLEEGCQPRMPWQDVHIKIQGPAVVDIHRNFARRWNSVLRHWPSSRGGKLPIPGSLHELPTEIDQAWLTKIGAMGLLQAAQTERVGTCMVQIVRSVSSKHLKLESSLLNGFFLAPDDLALLPNPQERTVMAQAIKNWREDHQANILNAMVNCIRSADNYIYIETQFFISPFGDVETHEKTSGSTRYNTVRGQELGNDGKGIENTILDELAKRIANHIHAAHPTNFHVYLVLPVHPEGIPNGGATWKQQWLAQAALKHGTQSLIKRIEASLKQRNRKPQEWVQYLTVLNMRNHGVAVQYARDPNDFREDFTREIGRYVVTEQIYVHSKLLIVDDAVAIVGSANINDRSLTGNGDTEIAAVVVDTADAHLEDLGSPLFKVATRKFARELRRSLWEKHFGFTLDPKKYFESVERAERKGVPSPFAPIHPPRGRTTPSDFFEATSDTVPWQHVLDKPCHPDSVRAIQTVVKKNRIIYEEVFKHTPRDSMGRHDDVLKHFTLAYAATADGSFQMAQQHANVTRDITLSAMRGPGAGKSTEQLEAQQRSLDAKHERNQRRRNRGVIPPALQPRFMTQDLLPHQREALKLPVTDVFRRYITYDGGQVHDVTKAIEYLRENLVGFFVEAPLDWGQNRVVENNVDTHIIVPIAQNGPSGPASS